MQGSYVAPPTPYPRWRLVTVCLAFFVTLLSMLDGFFQFEWVTWLCIGLFYLLVPYFQRRRGETLWAFLKTPQGIAAFALLAGMIVGMGRHLYMIFEKHR